MARPKSDDPKEAITIRLPRSIMKRLTAAASDRGRSPREHLEAMAVHTFSDDGLHLGPVARALGAGRGYTGSRSKGPIDKGGAKS